MSPLICVVRRVFGQACKLAGSQDAVAQELLPQLLPMFSIPSEQRAAYGSSVPPTAAGAQAGGAARGPEQSGYWDLIYILYPELLEIVGSAVVRELVPTWPLVERTLEVRSCALWLLACFVYSQWQAQRSFGYCHNTCWVLLGKYDM